ncbi:type VII secretion protein [Bifidobacterium anseris]|uniref:ESAT-6-like protein n=1 Tax=Bifidobacterium anseris TaxID=2020963 RepID=A0A2N5IZI6_9BIFI|nr:MULTISPECIES: WXG100 family type VII secretion target [Bifidobacterium]PLS27373.1 type VII secretion protein [Bifidobacterium anseris]
MAEKIAAGEGALEKGAVAVENARVGIDQRIKDIESKMGELGSFWKGDAATSYNALMMAWQEKANALNRILNDLRDNIRGTAKDQAANEADNQSQTSRLQALLG